ncbi:hypothetical protein [Kocuria turfanensis]|uniref:hypothetical protein n=1 Tax=Kocuria turfanensis TaxID=388357 RepID=UPI000ACC20E1|nr:hypothetical protein [Kocuria turfanensis]
MVRDLSHLREYHRSRNVEFGAWLIDGYGSAPLTLGPQINGTGFVDVNLQREGTRHPVEHSHSIIIRDD